MATERYRGRVYASLISATLIQYVDHFYERSSSYPGHSLHHFPVTSVSNSRMRHQTYVNPDPHSQVLGGREYSCVVLSFYLVSQFEGVGQFRVGREEREQNWQGKVAVLVLGVGEAVVQVGEERDGREGRTDEAGIGRRDRSGPVVERVDVGEDGRDGARGLGGAERDVRDGLQVQVVFGAGARGGKDRLRGLAQRQEQIALQECERHCCDGRFS